LYLAVQNTINTLVGFAFDSGLMNSKAGSALKDRFPSDFAPGTVATTELTNSLMAQVRDYTRAYSDAHGHDPMVKPLSPRSDVSKASSMTLPPVPKPKVVELKDARTLALEKASQKLDSVNTALSEFYAKHSDPENGVHITDYASFSRHVDKSTESNVDLHRKLLTLLGEKRDAEMILENEGSTIGVMSDYDMT